MITRVKDGLRQRLLTCERTHQSAMREGKTINNRTLTAHTAPGRGQFFGHIDAAGSVISGWAVRVGSTEPARLALELDSRPVAWMLPNANRPDIAEIFDVSCETGFEFDLRAMHPEIFSGLLASNSRSHKLGVSFFDDPRVALLGRSDLVLSEELIEFVRPSSGRRREEYIEEHTLDDDGVLRGFLVNVGAPSMTEPESLCLHYKTVYVDRIFVNQPRLAIAKQYRCGVDCGFSYDLRRAAFMTTNCFGGAPIDARVFGRERVFSNFLHLGTKR